MSQQQSTVGTQFRIGNPERGWLQIGAQSRRSCWAAGGGGRGVLEPDFEPLGLGLDLFADHRHLLGVLHGDQVVDLRPVLRAFGGGGIFGRAVRRSAF